MPMTCPPFFCLAGARSSKELRAPFAVFRPPRPRPAEKGKKLNKIVCHFIKINIIDRIESVCYNVFNAKFVE